MTELPCIADMGEEKCSAARGQSREAGWGTQCEQCLAAEYDFLENWVCTVTLYRCVAANSRYQGMIGKKMRIQHE